MRRNQAFIFSLTFLLAMALLHSKSWPQMTTVGQYEDEAPFRTWNNLGITTASSLALGETQLTSASDCSAAFSNPALLSFLPRITITLNSSLSSASFFKYSLVNTGVLSTQGNVSLSLFGLDFAGASLSIKNWTFALGAGLLESYHRPRTRAEYSSYFLNFDQTGQLRNINFSVARKVLGNLSAGIGLNFVYGDFKKEVIDTLTIPQLPTIDSLSHKFQGSYITAGLLLDIGDKIQVAASFRTPYIKKSESHSLKKCYSPGGETDIKIEASARSEYKQPLVAGLGLSYKFSPDLKVASDLVFFQWSKYDVIYFEQKDEIEREFKDIVKIGAGVEYLSRVKIFRTKAEIPLRAGLSYDPQPMKSPDSSYLYFSLGTGLHWQKFFLDGGILIGKESGSGDSLSAKRFALSVSFRL